MAEITEREYQLIIQTLSTQATSMEALSTLVRELSNKLAERYLTRTEDDQADRDMRDQIYTYIREQLEIERRVSNATHDTIKQSMTDQVSWMRYVLGGNAAAIIAIAGWIVTHLGGH